jgi:hypothetical protein
MRRTLIRVIAAILVLFLSILVSFGPRIQHAKAQLPPTQTYSDGFSTDSGLWQYIGSAYRDPTNQCLVLTTADGGQGGVTLFKYTVQSAFSANFSYKVSGGSGGDGFTLFFYKQPFATLDGGGGLAFSSIIGGVRATVPGYGIEFDAWQNILQDFQQISSQVNPQTGDPSSAHIALIQDYAGNHLTYVNDPRVDDGNWHNVSVVVGASSVSVYLDQGLALQWTGPFNTTFAGFGFSGATGCSTALHLIANFSITSASEPTTLIPIPTPIATPTPTYVSIPTAAPVSPPPRLPPEAPSQLNESAQKFSDDFGTNSGAWHYLGTAYRDSSNQNLVLTNTDNGQGGVAFFNYPIQGSFTANFSYYAGGGSGSADGLTMFFYKQNYTTFATGGGLAFSMPYGIVPGYGIEFDSWQNIAEDFQTWAGGVPVQAGDPSADHIALIQDYVGNHLAYVNEQRVADSNWHNVSVIVGFASVNVFVDQGLVLQWNGTLNRTYSGFGFSGATGGATDWHLIDNVAITAQNMQHPSLTTSCSSSVSQSSLRVQINGNLTFNKTGISGAPILLSYSVTGGESWQDLTLVNTGSDGSYSALWMPSVTGNYLLRAVYRGDDVYMGTNIIVSFAIQPYSNESVSIFSIMSNSTISELSFNSTSEELSFTVSGPSGTRGYVDLCIPKSLVSDVSGLKVYLDRNQTEYAAQSQGDTWLLHFTYHHSVHSVTVNLGSPITSPSLSQLAPQFPILAVVLLSCLAAASIVLAKKKRRSPIENS